jgi:mRNA-degrading endonuclease RelE of RelBE toxin-antitoxin system
VGDYRVVYTIDEEQATVDITLIAHRSKAYQK